MPSSDAASNLRRRAGAVRTTKTLPANVRCYTYPRVDPVKSTPYQPICAAAHTLGWIEQDAWIAAQLGLLWVEWFECPCVWSSNLTAEMPFLFNCFDYFGTGLLTGNHTLVRLRLGRGFVGRRVRSWLGRGLVRGRVSFRVWVRLRVRRRVGFWVRFWVGFWVGFWVRFCHRDTGHRWQGSRRRLVRRCRRCGRRRRGLLRPLLQLLRDTGAAQAGAGAANPSWLLTRSGKVLRKPPIGSEVETNCDMASRRVPRF